MSRLRLLIALAALVVLAAAGCSDKSKVGDQSLLNVKDKVNERLGESTTTVPPSTTTSAAGALRATSTTATTAKQAATTTSTTAVQLPTITINGDKSGKAQFDPSQLSVYVGTTVKWVNNDSVARSVVASNGAFRSPPIPPGGSWAYKTVTAGNFVYQDGTRPYANGTLNVVAK